MSFVRDKVRVLGFSLSGSPYVVTKRMESNDVKGHTLSVGILERMILSYGQDKTFGSIYTALKGSLW